MILWISTHSSAIIAGYDYLNNDLWDAGAGLYRTSTNAPDYTFTIFDLGVVLGAINALNVNLGLFDEAKFAEFYENAVNMSGMQIASGLPGVPDHHRTHNQQEAISEGADEFPDIFLVHPSLPMPPMADGTYGQAPVFAGEVKYTASDDNWWLTDGTFNAGGAMYASNEFIWFHADEPTLDPYPEILPTSADSQDELQLQDD